MLAAMTIRDLVRGLGGGAAVARARGVSRAAVSHWVVANEAPEQHHLALWQMALAAGLPWQPPGAEAIRAQLAATPPARERVA
jgi:hypothetical protein